jgi:hypothetical protein
LSLENDTDMFSPDVDKQIPSSVVQHARKTKRPTHGGGRVKDTANVLWDSVTNWRILEKLSDHQLLNNNSGTCSWFSSTSNPRNLMLILFR